MDLSCIQIYRIRPAPPGGNIGNGDPRSLWGGRGGAASSLRPGLCRLRGGFVVMSILWALALDSFRPDRWDWTGAVAIILGVAVMVFGPRH